MLDSTDSEGIEDEADTTENCKEDLEMQGTNDNDNFKFCIKCWG